MDNRFNNTKANCATDSSGDDTEIDGMTTDRRGTTTQSSTATDDVRGLAIDTNGIVVKGRNGGSILETAPI